MLQVEIVWQVDCKACWIFWGAFDGCIDSWGCWLICAHSSEFICCWPFPFVVLKFFPLAANLLTL